MGPEVYRELQRERYMKRHNREREKKEQAFRTEVEPHLAQPLSLPWLPLDWVEEEGEGSMAAPLPCPEVRDCCQQMINVLLRKK